MGCIVGAWGLVRCQILGFFEGTVSTLGHIDIGGYVLCTLKGATEVTSFSLTIS